MAEVKTPAPQGRRARRSAKRLEQQGHAKTARARPLRFRHEWSYGDWTDEPPEPEGGAGVREPRRPLPAAPTGAAELDLPRGDALDTSRL